MPQVLALIWAVQLNTVPDIYKGMLKGPINALVLQRPTVWLNLVG